MLEIPRVSLETFHCPNCASPLESSYCRYCGSTITSFLMMEKVRWPKERDLAIDLSLIALFDRLATEEHLETLNSISPDNLTMRARRAGHNFRDILVVHSSKGDSIFSGEAPLVYYIACQNRETGWADGGLRLSYGIKAGTGKARVYYLRHRYGHGLDHHPETLIGEIALAHSQRLSDTIKSSINYL